MRVGSLIRLSLFVVPLFALAACGRESQDWRAAQAADTIESYESFIGQHAQSEHAAKARERVKQLIEERDWERATVADTAESYRAFLAQHVDGRWAQEARIRIENFNVLEGATGPPAAASAPRAAPPAAAPTMTAPVAPTPAAVGVPRAPDATHRVQLGAFSTTQLADSEWARLQGQYAELKLLKSAVSPVQTPRGRLYRLQAAVASEQAARELCAKLKSLGQACIVVTR